MIGLTPLLFIEITVAHRWRHWLCGGFADGGVLDDVSFPQWQLDYLALLAQRDLPNRGLTSLPQLSERLFRKTTNVSGQAWNASQIGQSLGTSYHTVNRYIDHLEGAYVVTRLQPFATNVRKRLVKRPKLYWRDSGLFHALMRMTVSDFTNNLGLARAGKGTSLN